MRTHLKTEWLLAFQAVMLTGTVTEAAAQVLRTQPQVSRMIRALEDATDLTLFEREGRRLIPTDAGLRFLDYIQPTLTMMEGLDAFAEDTRQSRHAPLVTLAEPFLMQGLIPEALVGLAPRTRRSLGVDLCIRRIGVWQNRTDADFALVALPFPQTDFVALPFAEAEVVLVSPPGHALGRKPIVTFQDLAEHDFIALRSTTLLRAQIDTLMAAAGINLRPQLETDSGAVACDLVARGLGVAIADPLVARSFRDKGIGISRLETKIVIHYGFLLRTPQPPELIAPTLAHIRETALTLGEGLVRLI
jgi:DNA-binding transcriptional LysR family regulator